MTDNRRMTTDRFYGGVSNRLQNLQSMLQYIETEHPSREQLNEWVIANTSAGSSDAVSHHLTFLNAIEIIDLAETGCELGDYGDQWLHDQVPDTLYDALSSGVKGFDTILEALDDRPMTDEDIMNLLVREFDEAEMSKPGPAVRHREWLQVLDFVEREDGVNRLTSKGREVLSSLESGNPPTSMRTPPEGVSVGDNLSQEGIEAAFDTGFGYRISGINPRRDDHDRRYVLVFANEDGPYDDSVTQGKFEYIGEGLSGDQNKSSSGNSALIDAVSSNIPVHFFYQGSDASDWEYQGLVDVHDYVFEERDGRQVLVFTMENQSEASAETEEPSQEEVADERTSLERALDDDPQLTDEEEAYTEARRRARDTAFSKLVRDAYDNTCAVCGRSRQTPDGNPEVEAAHIYPKREGGSDDVRNGLALCKLHHWAFDVGWLAASDDYEILVKDAPDREGYYELKQLEGDRLHLPENEDAEPHPMFLEQHREIHGF